MVLNCRYQAISFIDLGNGVLSVMAIYRHLGPIEELESSTMRALLKGTSQALFLLAGLLFLFGGQAVSEYTKNGSAFG